MPLRNPVVVHHHDIHARNHNLRFGRIQSPGEKLLQKTPKEINPGPPNVPKKRLTACEESILPRLVLDRGGVAGIFPQPVKTSQMGTGAVHKETEKLLEDLAYRLPLPVLAQRTEEALQDCSDLHAIEVADKKVHPENAHPDSCRTKVEEIRNSIVPATTSFTQHRQSHNSVIAFTTSLPQQR